ncbi:MAG TPA: hypothetical protein VHE78_02000 [Gemmatimonadaceae bacterium]|nr:hypothetical protein [Gemmatimonadaceae bacterium]
MRTSLTRAAVSFFFRASALAIAGHIAAGRLDAQPPRGPASLTRDSLTKALRALQADAVSLQLPDAASFTFGDMTVLAGTTKKGPVAIADGTLYVRGVLDGDAVTYRGDIILYPGGSVSGNAIAILGRVTLEGGHVVGDARAIGGNLAAADGAAAVARTPSGAVLQSLALAGGWLAVLAIIGIAVLIFAGTNLDAVTAALERDFSRAFLIGIAGQLALLPALALLLVAVTLTVLGILLIPFAIVAYVIAAAGLVTLGYFAIARITGRTLLHSVALDERARRAASLKALLIGLVIVMSPWFAAAVLAWQPTASLVAHTMAFAITWVAATAGLGAALISRGGVRRLTAPAAQKAMSAASWQTPTPVSGIAAARRPTPAASTVVK